MPARVRSERTSLVEVLVGVDGRVHDAEIISGLAGLHEASLDAARSWVFRPARRNGRAVDAYAYLIFGFRAVVGAAAMGWTDERIHFFAKGLHRRASTFVQCRPPFRPGTTPTAQEVQILGLCASAA